MSKNNKYSQILNDFKDELKLSSSDSGKFDIPNILDFVYEDEYLGFSTRSSPIKLFPAQEIILKTFYRGSVGNEDLELTEDDIKACQELGLSSEDRGDILEKWNNGTIFRELVLVWGRRSGKDLIASVIAAYEAMKILSIPGGDPYAYYSGIASGQEIGILTIACSKEQAKIAFNYIRDVIYNSKYFKDKYLSDGFQSNSIYLLTPHDKKDNKERKERGMTQKLGSVVVNVGHSNSDSLRGFSIYTMILDEVALYSTTGSSSSGEVIYTALRPSLQTFVRKEIMKDELDNIIYDKDGNPVEKRIYDSRIVSISSPRGEGGIFYKLWKESHKQNSMLSQRLPTWKVNMLHTKESLREAEPMMQDDQFEMEYGAEFSTISGSNMFPRNFVEKVFSYNIKDTDKGILGKVYFAHLDPSSKNNNYALVVCHKEHVYKKEERKSDFNIIVDHIKVWKPTPQKPIDVEEIHQYMIKLKSFFHFGLVTYDQFNSMASINEMRKNGIPAKEVFFSKKFKMAIYDELYNLIVTERIKIPYNVLALNELLCLQKTPLINGYRVQADPNAEINTDDVADAIAGAAYSSLSSEMVKLPASRLVYGLQNTSNKRTWNSMSGPLGYGTGQQVSDKLSKRNSFPF